MRQEVPNMQQELPNMKQEVPDSQGKEYDHRFQRTDQWKPVYTWLESLNTDEVVKSKEISDWLNDSPQVLEELSKRHSRYHLLHYIKKCHLKLLKRRERLNNKVRRVTEKASSTKVVNKSVEAKVPAPVTYFGGNNLNNLPKDSDLYKAKQSEAQQKYEILLEFEKQLFTLFPDA